MRFFKTRKILTAVPSAGLLFFCLTSFSQSVTGLITGAGNQPLEGVTISLKNSMLVTTSTINGTFTIQAVPGDVLIFSSVGYQRMELQIGNTTNINVSLTLAIVNLDEVVVSGYTSQRVKDITGSVSLVRTKDLNEVPAGQTEQMLQGRVAGLTVITSGEPGSVSNIRLHGIGNFGNTTPLYVIDGIAGEINSINPRDIESLLVLKDAAAYSIYGVRGANGVIVITTKKGNSGKTRINYDFYTGVQEPLRKGLNLLTPKESADLFWIAAKNSGQVDAAGNPSHPLYGNGPTPVLPDYLFAGPHTETLFEGSPFVADSLYNLDPDRGEIYQIVKFNKSGTDWFHALFKPAWSQQHTLTVSGAGDKNKYLLSLGYLNQQGTLINTFLKRYTARVNTEFTVLDAIHIGENLQFSYTENPQSTKYNPPDVGYGDINSIYALNPNSSMYDIRGAYNGGNIPNGTSGPLYNPVAMRVLAKDNKGRNTQVFGNVFAEINFLKNFSFRTSFGGNISNFYNYNFFPAAYSYPNSGYSNGLTEASGYLGSTTWTNMLTYAKTFSSKHSIKILAGTEAINNSSREQTSTSLDLPFTDPNTWLLGNGDRMKMSNSSIATQSKLYSLISRLEYGYKERYLLTANLRRDGSSVFGTENRYGWFPSVGAAWRMSEEKFFHSFDWISELKLRASYGKTGYDGNTDPSNQFTLYGGGPGDAFYNIMGTGSGPVTRGYRVIRLGNAKTGWQQDVVTNIGIDGVLWHGKLSISADWYNKKSKGLLFPVTLPDLLGDVIPPNVNVGAILNRGLDLSLGTRGSFAKNSGWDLLLTFTQYKNKVLQLNTVPYFSDFFGWVQNAVGYPISSFYGLKVVGLFTDNNDIAKSAIQQDAAPGRFKYLDNNKDGIINDDDRIHFGNPNPTFTLGINIGLHYKNLDFSTFLYGSFGNEVLNLQKNGLNIYTGDGVYSKTALYDSWSPTHLDAKAPIPELSVNYSNIGQQNSYGLENGSYVRDKSMILGYTFPKEVIGKAGITRLRIYVQVANLFTKTRYTGLDPELAGADVSPLSTVARRSTFGIDTGNYPNNQKQYLVGVTVGL